MITSVVKNMTEDHVYITVTMISSELWSRELGLGDSTEHYYPNIVLNGGEYLEISYNGQRRRFTNGAESPFETNYILSTNSLDEFSVRFYRNSGDTIEMAAASGGPPDFSITPVGFIDIDYYRSIPITWSNARPGTNMNAQQCTLVVALTRVDNVPYNSVFDYGSTDTAVSLERTINIGVNVNGP